MTKLERAHFRPVDVIGETSTAWMQLMYDESADSNLGPFTVDARLTSVGGSVLYATGEGRVRLKHLCVTQTPFARCYACLWSFSLVREALPR